MFTSTGVRHGTGHGVGHYLNVHEGPQGIGTRISAYSQSANYNRVPPNDFIHSALNNAPLKVGMTLSNGDS